MIVQHSIDSDGDLLTIIFSELGGEDQVVCLVWILHLAHVSHIPDTCNNQVIFCDINLVSSGASQLTICLNGREMSYAGQFFTIYKIFQ